MTEIAVATINARYHHASLGLRYVFHNLGDLKSRACMREYTLEHRAMEIAEDLLSLKPRIIGLGVYIWNVRETGELVGVIKSVSPGTIIVLGGPEVGFADDQPDWAAHADYIVAGQADFAFRSLCDRVLGGDPPVERFIRSENPDLKTLGLPYELYSESDIENRLVYVEASRGCPFKCEFCISSLDKTAWNFPLPEFLSELDGLYQRGLRHFKFVDRTFNLKLSTARAILDFFLARDVENLFLHFELIPDRLPEGLKEYLVRFPPGSLQFEIGIQTFNPDVQNLISRRQDDEKTGQNLRWLRAETHAHIHADLIFGLPGEDLKSFAAGFNRLYSLNPHEIQVGILKRLRGTPLVRHEAAFDMRFSPNPPYNILSTSLLDFATTQRMQRFARYWDMIANSGRFKATLELFDCDQMFENFMALSDSLYKRTGKTHKIALNRLFDVVFDALIALGFDPGAVAQSLEQDFLSGGFKGRPAFLDENTTESSGRSRRSHTSRQQRHQVIPNTQHSTSGAMT